MKTLLDSIASKNKGNWENIIKDITINIGENLITSNDFDSILKSIINHHRSVLKYLKIEIVSPETGMCYYTYDDSDGAGKVTIAETVPLDSHGWYDCSISLWIIQPTTTGKNRDIIKSLITNLILAFWKPDLRDDKTRIISEANPKTKEIISNTIGNYLPDHNYVSYYFSDLDKFKEINTKYGQIQGDSAILQMAMMFTTFVMGNPAIVIHRSGDEFIFLFFSADAETSLEFAFNLQSHLKNAEFTLEKDGAKETLHKEITIGIKFQPSYIVDITTYEQEITLAEKSMKNAEGIKNYAISNVHNAEKSDASKPELNAITSNLSKIIVKTSDAPMAFSNVWLNLVTVATQKLLSDGRDLKELSNIVNWINIDESNICKSANPYCETPDYSKSLSAFDILIAIIRGIFVNETSKSLNNSYEIKKTGEELSLIDENGYELYKIKAVNNLELNVGSSILGKFAPVALLIQIGHEKLTIPESIFTDKIIVDDRPSKGGGLPDFWEVTIARLVSVLNLNKNIIKIYLLGDKQFAENTIQWLYKLSSGAEIEPREFEEVVYKINSTNTLLKSATERLKGNVLTFKSEDEIITSYSEVITNGKLFQNIDVETSVNRPRAFLQKELRLDNNALTNEDGFRVETLSEAFPLMLEIARKASINKQIIDQAGAKLGELIDFKVELSNPSKSPIPFYYRNDEDKFKAYFNAQFIDSKGLFAQRLNDQIDIVINHVVEVISNPNLQYATRRAILIIPNNINGKEFAPFGLVSVRIIPRMEQQNNVKISYSFTWRTVEALIGFPYSFYGSIKYSEHLTATIKSKLTNQNIDLSLDRISYIAHSLHIFMDDYGQSIAKRISDDASI